MEYNKLTERAQVVILEAENESEKFKHGYVGTEHILLGILKEDGYSAKLLKKYGVDSEKIRTMIQRYLGYGDIKRVDDNILLTPRTKRLVDESFAAAKKLNHKYVSPEHILLALLNQEEGMAYTILKSININFTIISEELLIFLSGTYEDKVSDKNTIESKKVNTPMLDKYGRDLTALSKEGSLDPVIGRDNETQRLLEILCRRIKNNPCLIGEPGVGKTAVVEGLAQRIVEGNIPEILKNKRVISLDLTSMIAGAKYRGEFEERLKKTMEEIVKDNNIIIFIDEIHTIIGAGGAEGAIDASNILKPALARGEMQCIGATTIDEYRKYIEKDSALERRFQPVTVGEPTKEETLEILKGLRDKYEAHHRVEITDEALEAAVNLSDRYITDRFMPDKAIDLIDEGAAKVRIQNLTAPPDLKDLEEKIENIGKEKEEAIRVQDFERAQFLGFGDKEKTAEELIKKQGYRKVLLPLFNEFNNTEVTLIKNIIASYSSQRVVFLAEQDQFYRDQFGVMNEIIDKFYKAKARENDKLIYSKDNFNIAIHVRRGDIVQGQEGNNQNILMRWQTNEYFETVLSEVIEKIKQIKPIAIYLFSQGDRKDFSVFEQFENIHFCLDMDAQNSFLHMVYADLLITSKSSFSYKPALLNKGIKVCPRNFWHGYPETKDWILISDTGLFDNIE